MTLDGFQWIDEILFEADSFNCQKLHEVLSPILAKVGLGPTVEYQYLQRQPENQRWPSEFPVYSALQAVAYKALNRPGFSDNVKISSLLPLPLELLRCPTTNAEFAAPIWLAFRMRLQKAAEQIGVDRRIAQGLSAVLDELVSNTIEHSQAPSTCMIGYELTNDLVSFVVADAGEGVLRSLQRCDEFRHLRDSGEALVSALTDGITRFGSSSGRGGGFRQVLRSLDFAGCELRFRSGSFHLELGGDDRTLGKRKLGQSPEFQGFFVNMIFRKIS